MVVGQGVVADVGMVLKGCAPHLNWPQQSPQSSPPVLPHPCCPTCTAPIHTAPRARQVLGGPPGGAAHARAGAVLPGEGAVQPGAGQVALWVRAGGRGLGGQVRTMAIGRRILCECPVGLSAWCPARTQSRSRMGGGQGCSMHGHMHGHGPSGLPRLRNTHEQLPYVRPCFLTRVASFAAADTGKAQEGEAAASLPASGATAPTAATTAAAVGSSQTPSAAGGSAQVAVLSKEPSVAAKRDSSLTAEYDLLVVGGVRL